MGTEGEIGQLRYDAHAFSFHESTVLVKELKDLLGYWVLPLLTLILPWNWCWSLFRRVAARDWLYREESQAMQNGLHALKPEADTTHWVYRFRLAWLLEQADLFIFLCCPGRHLKKCWQTPEGQWPKETPFISLFFNFGFGLLVLEQLRAGRLHPSLVYAPPPDQRPDGMSRCRYAYMRLRTRAMQKACEHRAIPTGGAWPRIQQALAEHRTVVVVADAPSRPGNRTIEVELFGRRGQWRRGVPEMVVEAGLPAVAFRVRIDWESGQRQLVLSRPLNTDTLDSLVRDLRRVFHQGMQEHPETWLYWTALEVFLPELQGTNPAADSRYNAKKSEEPQQ